MSRRWEMFKIYVALYFAPRHWSISWKGLFEKTSSVLGVISVIITIYLFFQPNPNLSAGMPYLPYLIVASIVIGIYLSLPPLSVVNKISGGDITISIEVGSVFNQNGDVVVPTNTSFETKMDGDFTSKSSIQGQVFLREYEDIEELDGDIERQLHPIEAIGANDDNTRKNKIYNIGTVVKLNHSGVYNSYWLALANINDHGKPDGRFENIQLGLSELWKYLGSKGHMEKLVVPILGSGRTGVVESRFEIFQEIVVSFIAHTIENTQKITEDLVICIHPNDLITGKVDIYEMEKYLDCQCCYKYKKKNIHSTSWAVTEW